MTRKNNFVCVKVKTPVTAMMRRISKKNGRCRTRFKLMFGKEMRVAKAPEGAEVRVGRRTVE